MNHQTRTTDAMNDQTRTDRARRGERTWRIPSASVAFAAKQTNEWHRWYAWHPVICDNASGGVAWGSTLLRRRKRGQWVYRMRLRNRDIQRHYYAETHQSVVSPGAISIRRPGQRDEAGA